MTDWSVTPQQRASLERIAQQMAQRIGGAIDGTPLSGRVGFCLILMTWEPGFATWVSNGQRADAIKMLREMADALEARQDSSPMAVE